MDDIDMTGVDPLRWTETKRRVGVVSAFVAIDMPSDEDKKRHAQELDLSVNQFMALVRAWRAHRSAAKLACSGAHRRAPRRPSRLAVDPGAKAIAMKVIAESGPNAPFVGIVRAATMRCAEAGLVPPSRATIWLMVSAAPQSSRTHDDWVLVAMCRVRLPVDVAGTLVLPTIILAVRSGDGAVLAAAMPATSADWAGVARRLAGPDVEVRIDKSLLAPRVSVDAATKPATSTAARSAVSRILRQGLDNVRLAYVVDKAVAPERLLKTKEDGPLDMDDARSIVAAAVERHNGARGGKPAVWIG